MIIPKIFPDELGFSFLQRLNSLNAYKSREFEKYLNSKVKLNHLGSQKLHLQIADILNISPQEFIFRHTTLPVTKFISSGSTYLDFEISCMEDSRYIKSSLQPKLPLKTCKLCIQSDITKFGFSYFRTYHQYPGFDICNNHEIALHYSNPDLNLSPDTIMVENLKDPSLDYPIYSPEIGNFRNICMLVSSRTKPVTIQVIRKVLIIQSARCNVTWKKGRPGKLLSDLIFEKFPTKFLEKLFPKLETKQKNELHTTDRLLTRLTANPSSSSTSVLIALSALFSNPEDVITEFDEPPHPSINRYLESKAFIADFFKYDQNVNYIFEKHSGNMVKIAEDIGHPTGYTSKQFADLGLPSPNNVHMSTLFAFFDFHDGLSFEEACKKNAIPAQQLEALLRLTSRRFKLSLKKAKSPRYKPIFLRKSEGKQ